jgi:hypothetical protein
VVDASEKPPAPRLDPRATERNALGDFKYPAFLREQWMREHSKRKNVFEREQLEQVVTTHQGAASRNLYIAAAVVGVGILVALVIR